LKATAEFVFESEDAESIYLAILPELETPVSDRSVIGMSVRGSSIMLNIETDDVISMRSALNTWFRLVQIAHEVSQTTRAALMEA